MQPAVSKKLDRAPAGGSPIRPLRLRPHARDSVTMSILAASSYVVIHFQAPNTDALWQKSENKWRNLGLKHVAHGDARRRLTRVDQFENALGDKFGFGRILHVAIDCDPRLGHACLISRG